MSNQGPWGSYDPVDWAEAVLGLAGTYSRADAKRAYAQAARRWHPDSISADDLAADPSFARICDVNRAYSVIREVFQDLGPGVSVMAGTYGTNDASYLGNRTCVGWWTPGFDATAAYGSSSSSAYGAETSSYGSAASDATDYGYGTDYGYDTASDYDTASSHDTAPKRDTTGAYQDAATNPDYDNPWYKYDLDADERVQADAFMARPLIVTALRTVARHIPWNLIILLWAWSSYDSATGTSLNPAPPGTQIKWFLILMVALFNMIGCVAWRFMNLEDIIDDSTGTTAMWYGLGFFPRLLTVLIFQAIDRAFGIEEDPDPW